ncbi:MAG: hypothetical protein ACXIUW_14550 [Roseinatronobacter sp.]
MQPLTNTAPVPFARALPARTNARSATSGPRPEREAFALSAGATRLETSSEVERYLPDILGRALARCWIDARFRDAFCADPRGTLAAHKIELPAMIRIEVVQQGQARPMVVVSEQRAGTPQARRLMYLQLVMVAGK